MKKDLSLYAIKKRHILAILELVGGNQTHAAAILKIHPRTIRNLLNELQGKVKK